MVTRPEPISLTDEERRIVALYLREKPRLASREQVTRVSAALWDCFMADAREFVAALEGRKNVEDEW